MKIVKTVLITFGILIITAILIFFGTIFYYSYQDAKFYNIEIPDNLKHLTKPNEGNPQKEIDSLKSTNPESEKLLITGSGYSGYNFYFWHKAEQKGELYVRAYELTQDVEIMEKRLPERTKKRISQIDNEYHFFNASTVIFEGTFDKYYPTRFELWFKPYKNGKAEKLTEIEYLIDGWDR